MTTYILHGGYYKRNTPDNKKFFKAITKCLPNNSQMLFVAYARDKSDWQEKMEMFEKQIAGVVTGKKINFVLASENKDAFIKQIKNSDAIFLIGGKPKPLYNYLKKVPNLKGLWKNKIVIGSSAGVWVLSKYYCLWKTDDICKGLGILPIKTLVHWAEEQSGKLEKLKSHGEDLEMYKIPEEKFFVVK